MKADVLKKANDLQNKIKVLNEVIERVKNGISREDYCFIPYYKNRNGRGYDIQIDNSDINELLDKVGQRFGKEVLNRLEAEKLKLEKEFAALK